MNKMRSNKKIYDNNKYTIIQIDIIQSTKH